MRETLKQLEGRRFPVRAVFVRFGSKPAYKGPPIVTLLLHDVTDETGHALTDHVWFTTCKAWQALDLKPGDQVSFEARVKPYWKGYVSRHEDNRTLDYRLSHPTHCRKFTTAYQRGVLFEMLGHDDLLDGLRPRRCGGPARPRPEPSVTRYSAAEELELALDFPATP